MAAFSSSIPSRAQISRLIGDSHFRPPVLLMDIWISYLKDEATALECPSGHPSFPTGSHHLLLSSPPHSSFPPILHAITRETILKYYFYWSPILVQMMSSKIPSRTFKPLQRLMFHSLLPQHEVFSRHFIVCLLSLCVP